MSAFSIFRGNEPSQSLRLSIAVLFVSAPFVFGAWLFWRFCLNLTPNVYGCQSSDYPVIQDKCAQWTHITIGVFTPFWAFIVGTVIMFVTRSLARLLVRARGLHSNSFEHDVWEFRSQLASFDLQGMLNRVLTTIILGSFTLMFAMLCGGMVLRNAWENL